MAERQSPAEQATAESARLAAGSHRDTRGALKIESITPAKGPVGYLDQEIVTIAWYGAVPLSLRGWQIRDKNARDTYTFGDIVLAAGTRLRLHNAGDPCRDTPTDIYWGHVRPHWCRENQVLHLLDPEGIIHAQYLVGAAEADALRDYPRWNVTPSRPSSAVTEDEAHAMNERLALLLSHAHVAQERLESLLGAAQQQTAGPGQSLRAQSLPVQSIPAQSLPVQSLPVQSIAVQGIPAQHGQPHQSQPAAVAAAAAQDQTAVPVQNTQPQPSQPQPGQPRAAASTAPQPGTPETQTPRPQSQVLVTVGPIRHFLRTMAWNLLTRPAVVGLLLAFLFGGTLGSTITGALFQQSASPTGEQEPAERAADTVADVLSALSRKGQTKPTGRTKPTSNAGTTGQREASPAEPPPARLSSSEETHLKKVLSVLSAEAATLSAKLQTAEDAPSGTGAPGTPAGKTEQIGVRVERLKNEIASLNKVILAVESVLANGPSDQRLSEIEAAMSQFQ